MASQEGQVCASCAGFNLAAAFDPDQFETLPRLDIHSLGTLESVHPGFQDALKKRMQNPSPEWIRCVGSWNPPDPNNSDIRSGCSFCALLIDMAVREPSVLVALPSHMLYDIAETSTGEFTCSMPENSLLVISKPLLALRTGEGQEGWKDWVRLMCKTPFATISRCPRVTVAKNSPSPVSAKTRLLRHDTIDHDVLVNWLATCIAQHGDECTPTAGPPVPKLKLIDCRARRIINVLPEQKYEYVALSYVWGIGPLEPYIYPMLPENLPLVIRDAMALVLRLGYQYLWVDRYCIWQDEPDQSHKMSQVNKMNQIYGGALLTIYACAGEEPNYGLPGVSTRQRYDFQLSKIVSGMTLVTNRGHHAQIKRISTSRWKSRGWTFQEEALSRRRLYITDYQASFVCSKVTYFEHLESPLSFSSNTGDFERPFWNGINVPYGIWPIISQYSSRQLTYQGDRINAITGVLNQWSQLHPNCFHYWGVPVVGAPSCWRLPDHIINDAINGLNSCSEDWGNFFRLHFDHDALFGARKLTKAFLAGLYVLPEIETRQMNARNHQFPSWSWAGLGKNLRFLNAYGRESHGLAMRTTGFDAEVWVERPDGTTIEWERFVSGGGCNLPDKTPYLHIECWVFKVGPFREYKLKESGESVCGIPTSSNHQDAPKQVRTFTPDSFHDASSNLFKSEFTAISFEPPKTARYALVTDTIGSALERIGLLELLLSHEVAQDNTEPQTTEDKLSEHDDDFPQAHRCRIRLG